MVREIRSVSRCNSDKERNRCTLVFNEEATMRNYDLIFSDQPSRDAFVQMLASINPAIHTLTKGDHGPAWVPDSEVDRCMHCNSTFSLTFRRHHCRGMKYNIQSTIVQLCLCCCYTTPSQLSVS